MSQEKTVAQELFDDNVETPPESLTLGGEQGDKPTIEGDSGRTKQQEFEDELFSTEDSAETTSNEEQKEEPEGKQEKSKTDSAFWQKQYQEFDAMVKKANPILRDNLNKQLRAQRKGVTEELPDSFEKATQSARAEKVDVYENPEGFLDAMQKQLDRHESNMSSNYKRMQDQTYEQASWEQEAKAAELAVNQLKSNYRAELKLDDNAWKGVEDNAWQSVSDVFGLTEANKNDFFGSLGGPSQAAKVFQLSLENKLLKHSYLRKVAEGQADISGKIKAAAEVAQPTTQASPAPKTISKKEKLIRAIEGAKGDQSAKDEIFGG